MGKQHTRKLAAELAEEAMKAGLSADQALDALRIGAKFLAFGFNGDDVSAMVFADYQRRAKDARKAELTGQ